jgi:hypothetical protein
MATGPLIEEVATNLEEAAAVTRRLNAEGIGFFITGAVVGAALGFYFGYRWNREKIRAEVLEEAEKTIADIREVYRETYEVEPEPSKKVPEKPSLDEVVEEKGYSGEVVEERPLRPPVVVAPPRTSPASVRDLINEHPDNKDKNEGWDYATELAQRQNAERPYIIHQDEYMTNESGYSQVTLTYYAGDDVITEENDTVLENADGVIGLSNLIHWGHGSDDINVVYIRNPKIEVEYEVCRSPKSYAEEIQGLEHSDSPGFERMPRRHGTFDDDKDE